MSDVKNTNKTYNHTLNFFHYEEMDYAANVLECYVKNYSDLNKEEFEGDKDNEVTFTTSKPISAAAIKKMRKELDPLESRFNEEEVK